MAEILDDKAIQAGAILYLLDTGNEVMANALLACQLTITGRTQSHFDTVEIAGREPDLQKLRAIRTLLDPFMDHVLNPKVYTAIQGALPQTYTPFLANIAQRV